MTAVGVGACLVCVAVTGAICTSLGPCTTIGAVVEGNTGSLSVGVSDDEIPRSPRLISSLGGLMDGFTSAAVGGSGSGATTFFASSTFGVQITTVGTGVSIFNCNGSMMSGWMSVCGPLSAATVCRSTARSTPGLSPGAGWSTLASGPGLGALVERG